MAATLYSVVISGTNNNLFTYTGNITGAMSTYAGQVSGIIAGAAGANPTTSFDQFDPKFPQFSDIINFQSGRSYLVAGNQGSTFSLGVSGTASFAMPDKRFIHSRKAGGVGSDINIVGYDDNFKSSPLSAAFNKPSGGPGGLASDGGVFVFCNYDNEGRQAFKVWNSTIQATIDNPLTPAAQRTALLDNPGNFFRLEPLSSYLVRSYISTSTSISGERINSYLLTDNKDFQNDNIFITTNDGKYIKI